MTPSAAHAYGDDLAYIHDAGFGHIAEQAAELALDELKQMKLSAPLLVDLGCGSGILAKKVTDAGIEVIGFDQSAAMIQQCRARVPGAIFHQASFLDAELPQAGAVTAVGEVFSYMFDSRNGWGPLKKLLGRIHRALAPGGVLIFDVVTAGRAPPPEGKSGFREGKEWACLYSQVEEPTTQTLVRKITTFRQWGDSYQRTQETHRLKLFDTEKILQALCDLGFRARKVRSYGNVDFPKGLVGFVARKH